MSSEELNHGISLVMFRLGQVILSVGYVCYIIGVTTPHWVDRPEIRWNMKYDHSGDEPKEFKVIKHYGIFNACKQSLDVDNVQGECGSTQEFLEDVDDDSIKLIQAMMVITCILYLTGFILDVVQLLPISIFRNFLAENRVVEMFSGCATVIAFVSMMIFGGEVKNKAELFPGQNNESIGWSFRIAITGVSLCIFGLLSVTIFRHLPVSDEDTHYSLKGGSWLRTKPNTETH